MVMRFFTKVYRNTKTEAKRIFFQNYPAMEISETDSGKEEMGRQT